MKRFLVIYFIFTFSFFSFFASGFVDSQDGLQYLTIARRIYYDHTFEMPEASYTKDFSNIHFNTVKVSNGKEYAPTGIGYSLALIPAVIFEDLFLKIANTPPLEAFPLQSDWPVLLFASMTNAFFGAVFVVSFYYFLRLLKVDHNNSLFLSFFTSIASSVFIYAKHTFAHMMFVSFMFLSFLFFKKYALNKRKRKLFFAGLAFGVTLISYNSTYLFVLPALGIYYLVLNNKNFKEIFLNIKKHFINGIIFLAGLTPFYLLNYFFVSLTKSDWAVGQISRTTSWIKPYVFVEGFWGILFSPGKSLFLYSPILLILIIFWHKLDFKKYKAEIISAFVLFITYFFFIGTLMGGPDVLVWHGDSSFGNRYMLAVFPFFLILISLIYLKLTKKVKSFIFYPILFISIGVQIIGISQPYQIRFAGLQRDFSLNGRNSNVYEYGNIYPRYSPLLSLSKKFVRKILDSKQLLNKSRNQISFYDGFGYPFGSTGNYLRSMEEYSLLKVPKNSKLALKIVNHQIVSTSTYSAQIKIENGNQESFVLIEAGQEKIIELKTKSDLLNFNKIFLESSVSAIPKEQVVFVTQAWVNDQYQNINTISYPYVSPISKSISNIQYQYWGNQQTDPWSIWHMHSGVYEKTFDFWWLRPFQYWDMPKKLFALMFVIDVYLIIQFGYKSFKSKID